MIAAAGAKPDPNYPLDGEDLAGVLKGKPLFDRTFFWRTFKQGAMRSGKWKYIREGKNESLHDLSADDHEQAEFSAVQPQVLSRLRGEFQSWESGMMKYPAA
jgi:arylsulfatase A-like enzyme